MKLKTTLFIPVYFCAMALAFAQQKKPLTHEVYDEWKSLENEIISRDGKQVLYVIEPQEGDSRLHLGPVRGDQTIYERGKNAVFTYDSKYAIFQVSPQYDTLRQYKLKKKDKETFPKDSLFVVDLENNELSSFERVQNYKTPEKGSGWLAFLLEKELPTRDTTKQDSSATKPADTEGNKLMVMNLENGSEESFSRVTEYSFAQDGSMLSFVQAAADSASGSSVWSLAKGAEEPTLLDSGKVTYSGLALSNDGSKIAFLGSEDSTKADHRYFNLYLSQNGSVSQVADTTTSSLPEDWMVSEFGSLSFSDDGERLFFGTAPRPVEYAYENDTTILDEERVSVDVWTWKDPTPQPMQLKRADEEKKRTYTAMYQVASGKVLQLATEEMPDIRFDDDKALDVAIGYSSRPYQLQMSWDYPFYADAYLVNLQDGSATMMAEKTADVPRISAEGKYASWYQVADSSWYVYRVSSGEKKKISQQITFPLYDVENDIPAAAGAYGMAGWTEGDKAILIYDEYDIWKINPENAQATNLTDGVGRKNGITFRYEDLNQESPAILAKGPFIVSAFDNQNKQSGFYQEQLNKNASPKKLVMGDYMYYGLQKAENASDVLFKKSSYTDYADIWYSDLTFANAEKISTTNPQQDEYLWGTAELTTWRGFNGEELQGIVYKPENFDPDKKYPMMVYFYERYSDLIHYHRTPSPSRSTINIPLFVSNGYVVFVPDIVYRDGYPGQSAYDCVVPGVLSVIDQGFVDPKKVGIQGQSWGGYQVAYLVTRTDMFAAAEAGAPVANMTSAYGGIRWGTGMSRAFQYEKTQSRIGGSLWEKPLQYLENSPLFSVDRIKTPLMIMHNDKDGAVPWYQGIELFMAMRRLQKPAWMVVYNGEDHNLTQRKNEKDLSIRLSQFFDHYLKGAPVPVWMEEGVPAIIKGRDLGYELENNSENSDQ